MAKTDQSIGIEDIRDAAAAIDGQIIATPTLAIPTLDEHTGAHLHLKLENLQHTGSFKPRGAANKLRTLSTEARAAGIVACSAGNHAQGVAFFSQRLGIPTTIVLPVATPFTKIKRTQALGAKVELHGESLSDSETYAHELEKDQNLTFIHPYDDPLIIAGQGTIALELLQGAPDLDAIIVPIGGGGLIAGIATVVKAIKPEIEVIGVEAALYPSMFEAVNQRPSSSHGTSLADGIAVKAPGALTRPIIEALVDDIVLVDEPTLEAAVQTLAETAHMVAEGAGAASLGAVLNDPDRFRDRQTALIVSGGNIDHRLLASVLLRGLARAGRMIRVRVLITDRPGSLARITAQIAETGGDIVEIIHQRLFFDVSVKQADLDIVIETRGDDHADEIIARLEQAGYPTTRLSFRATDPASS
ncbi:MAG: threonine ammonia-lyase [Alphaproteobacteria bacterium]